MDHPVLSQDFSDDDVESPYVLALASPAIFFFRYIFCGLAASAINSASPDKNRVGPTTDATLSWD